MSVTQPSGSPTRHRVRAVASLAVSLLPGGGPAVRWYQAAAVFVSTAVLAFFRLGSASVHARMWAEDGAVFLQQAEVSGPINAVRITYAGYLNSVPRLAAAVVYPLPVRMWAGAGHAVTALIVAAVATLVFAALADHLRSPGYRAVMAAYVAAVPVGPEVTCSTANLQWFVFTGALVALLWTPKTRWGWAAIAIAGLTATTTSPFAAIVLVAALVRLALQRRRATMALAAVVGVGFVLQTIAMVFGTPRAAAIGAEPDAAQTARGYLTRVVGDGVLGMGRSLPAGIDKSVIPGAVVLVAAVVIVIVTIARHRRPPWLLAALLVGLSAALYFLSVRSARPDLTNSIYAGRYWVLPSTFLVLALLLVAFGGPRATRDHNAALDRWLTVGLTVGVVGCLTFAVVTSYQVGDVRNRNKGLTWAASVRAAQQVCAAGRDRRAVDVVILPSTVWTVSIPCEQLEPR